MNKVEIVGTLTADPKQNDAKTVTTITVAARRKFVKEGEKDADFITCKAFNKPGEFVAKYFKKGMKIGIAREYFDGIREDVRTAVDEAVKTYESLGAEIVYFDMPSLKYALPVYYIIACAEASSNLGRYDGIRYGFKAENYRDVNDMVKKTRSMGFGEEVKRRILLGTYVLSSGYYDAYYKKAQNLRGSIVNSFKKAFESCDIMLAPTVPMTAFENGHAVSDPVETYLTDICTVPANICGLPGISVPCGQDAKGMPIGLQLIGNSFCEAKILNAAWQYENAANKFKAADFGVKL